MIVSLLQKQSTVASNSWGRLAAAFVSALCLLSVATFLGGCGDDESTCFEDERYVPMLPGVTWTYRVTGWLDGSLDTLVVRSVSDTVNTAWDDGAVWEFERNGVRRREVAVVRGDTVAIRFAFRPDFPTSFRPILTFVLPLQVGNSWDGRHPSFGGPSHVEVIARDTIQVPAGRFESAFRVRELGGDFNEHINLSTNVQPGVGVVRVEYQYSNFSLDGATLELLSYSTCTVAAGSTAGAPTRPGPSSWH